MVVDTPYSLNRVRVRWIPLLSLPAVVKSITTVGSRAFHKDKRRIPGTSDRPTTKRTRRSIGGANGGIRPSPLDPIPLPPSWKSYSKARLASPNSASPFHYTATLLLLALPFSSFTLYVDTSNVKSTFSREESRWGRLFAIRFQKRGGKDRGDRIWPPREIIGKKKKVMDILPSMEKISRFLFYFRSRVK